MFKRVLIANRGEIAVRVIAACQELGIHAIAVYSEADRDALHVRRADEARCIGPAPVGQSYLNIPAIIAAARASGAEAIHPGYGFLSENADFAQACADAGLVFIGPPPAAIRLMGSKIAAKRAVEAAGVPTVPGYAGPSPNPPIPFPRQGRGRGDGHPPDALLAREAQRIGYPVMIKASAGGGGKGMRTVREPSVFAEALEAARREALTAFGDDSVFLEKLVVAPRHVEFQVLADTHGHVIHLGERECSIQRRHQKIVEESPCVALTPALRAEMGAAAVAAARAAGYVNAGTCEFLLDATAHGCRYYFLEMNTRLQVEHPVTEGVTGLDLVRHQLAIAAGEPLSISQEQIVPRGHAIEARLYAEDPANQYLPSTGTLLAFDAPRAPGVRVDAGVVAGDEVSMYYDPMLAKLIVHAEDRPAAVARLRWALDHFAILGVTTNLPLLRAIAADEQFAAGRTNTDFLTDRGLAELDPPAVVPPVALVAAAAFELLREEPGAESAAGVVRRSRSPWSRSAVSVGGERRARYRWNGRDHAVTLSPLAGLPSAYQARVDGAPYPGESGDPPPPLVPHLRPGGELTLAFGDQLDTLRVAAQTGSILVAWRGLAFTLEKPRPPDVDTAARGGDLAPGQQRLVAPMAGTIIKVNVAAGDHVKAHQTLVVLGAMKMEHAIAAPYPGHVRRITHAVGDVVPGGEPLVELETSGAPDERPRQDGGRS